MAAVVFADGVERDKSLTKESKSSVWVSPNTMDSNDTVTLPTITGRTPRILSCWDNSNGDVVTASISGQVVTIDAAGGDTDNVYVLNYFYE